MLREQLLRHFDRIILCDTEFFHPGKNEGNIQVPICVCVYEVRTKASFSLWCENLRMKSPFPFSERDVFICYNAGAEFATFNVLGWPLPLCTLDLLPVFRQQICLIPREDDRYGLAAALEYYGISTPLSKEYKSTMRDLCLRGFPFSNSERARILAYCMTDTTEMLTLMEHLPEVDLNQYLSYGRYMRAVAHMEQTGLPVCTRTHTTLRDNWGDVKGFLQRQVNAIYPLYDEDGTFKKWRFEEFLRGRGYYWERTTKDGSPKLDTEYFKDRALVIGGDIARIYERWKTLQPLKTFAPPVGEDGFCRTGILPFASQTSRNQPSSSAFVMAMASWLRSLLMAPPGYALVYADYSQQEFLISAILSGDEQMRADYYSGDVYMTLAQQLFNLPSDATKKTHPEEREKVKVMTLGTQYCMGAEGLSIRAGDPVNIIGSRFLDEFERRYRVFDEWKDAAVLDFADKGYAETALGWRLYNGGMGSFDPETQRHNKPNVRSITNFPVQGTGADILRVACAMLYEAGITICAPVHDAVMLLLPTDDTFSYRLHYALYLMMKAAEAVLGGGNALKVEAAIYPHGTYYTDPRGESIWREVKQIPSIAGLPQGHMQGKTGTEIKPSIAAVKQLFE